MGTHPAQPPSLHVTPAVGSTIVRSIVEAPGADTAFILLIDGARCYVRSSLNDAERERLLHSRSEAEVLTLLEPAVSGTRAVIMHADLMPMLAALGKQGMRWLMRSPRDAYPLAVSELLDDRTGAEAALCRDDECSGKHVWLLHHRPGDGRIYWFIWHMNLLTGFVVPPTPMELR